MRCLAGAALVTILAVGWAAADEPPAHREQESGVASEAQSPGADISAETGASPERRLHPLDWLILAAYAGGMLAVGWYYARRTGSTEDYLLGGRRMRGWTIGLSLFATLLSSLSYLSWTGEMIDNGPMFLAQIVAFPVAAVLVGWILIPLVMRWKVTSAYEILELRLGIAVRMTATFLFLSLRLSWMAMIIAATTKIVLMPVLGLEPWAMPLVCACLALVTVVYTSMGGLRAVVLTDVVQTFVLFGGAVLSLVLITHSLGGVGPWWPSQWAATWQSPAFWPDPSRRDTLGGFVLLALSWHVCTAGADQMALQRYLSTRNVRSARRAYVISLVADALVMVLMAMLGLALAAYFRVHPELLAEGQTVANAADKLFPRFIVVGLPPGISGLVVAGLLAAAMSSVSSGVNSSCSVITADFIDRFGGNRSSGNRSSGNRSSGDTRQVRRAKIVSLWVGVVVVALSLAVGTIEGNLFEVVNKVVNLFVAPLFVLFVMALFVPWANTSGTLVAVACSVAAAVAIAFFQLAGLSFVWIMPVSLVVGVATGMAASGLTRCGVAIARMLAFRRG